MDQDMPEAPRDQPIQPPTFKAPKMVSRPKPPVQKEEELGAEPQLGDFEGEHALSISEARAIVVSVHANRRKFTDGRNPLGGDRVHNDSAYVAARSSKRRLC
jgi:DNA-directed RNA polymerase II subunit RPB4